jgi:hypothetical protein
VKSREESLQKLGVTKAEKTGAEFFVSGEGGGKSNVTFRYYIVVIEMVSTVSVGDGVHHWRHWTHRRWRQLITTGDLQFCHQWRQR